MTKEEFKEMFKECFTLEVQIRNRFHEVTTEVTIYDKETFETILQSNDFYLKHDD